MSELELIRRLMADVPLLFGIISQDYMNLRVMKDTSQSSVGILSNIYEQMGSIGYLNDMGHATPLAPSSSGKDYHRPTMLSLCVCVI